MLPTFNLDKSGNPAFPANFRILKTAVLNRADLRTNNNKFYVLEVHEAQGQYRLFTNYGRVGTPGVREGRYTDDLQDALAEFERLYREKTGKSKGYVPVDVRQAMVGSATLRDHVSRNTPAPPHRPFTAISPATALHPDVARFVERIYDAGKSELARRIETPLGSLSRTQIERGQDKLREIRFAIARRRSDMLVNLTGEYYSLVPHRLGLRFDINAVVIDTVKKADDEEDLLQLMRDVFAVQNDLEADVERKYRALGAEMRVLDKVSAEYQRVEHKILGSRSWRHNFTLRVRRVFALALPEERVRFTTEGQPVGNVQELFHGTLTCNLVGVLSRGLLIAPRSAPCNGAMFGKGIYFADQSSKSAQYCDLWNGAGKPQSGYLFLSDVALGNIKKEKLACYREQAPEGYDSVQGCKGLYLAHNEFIVYKTSQCALRYIAEIEAC